MLIKGDSINRRLLFGGLLFLILLVFYTSVNSYFVTDDLRLIYISSPLTVESFSDFFTSSGGFFGGYYRPLVRVAFFIDHSLYDLNPAGYHITNLLLHFIVTVLLFYFAKLLTESEKAAAFAALVFAVHPLHTESVTWISGRSDLILSVFYMLAVLSFIRYLSDGRKEIKYLVLSAGSFCLALLTKESAVTLPLMLVLTEMLLNKMKWSRKGHKIVYRAYLPFAIIFSLYAFLKLFLIKGTSYDFSVGADSFVRTAYHLVQLFAPINIDTFTIGNTPGFFLNTALILIFAGMFYCYWRFAADKKRALPLYLYLTLWVMITWFPIYFSSGVRFTYIATIASSAAMGFIFSQAYAALSKHKPARSVSFASVLIICILITFSARTIQRNGIYNYAGGMARGILLQLKGLHPEFPAGSSLYFINFPHEWIRDTETYVKPIPVMGMAIKVNYSDDSLVVHSKKDNLSTSEDKRLFLEERAFGECMKEGGNCRVFELRQGRVIETTEIFVSAFTS